MSLLSGTTWQFNQTPIAGTITFQQVGPDPRAGTVTVSWGQMNSITGTYAQSLKGNYVVISYAPFQAAEDGTLPPPFGIPTINADGENGDPIPVVLAGVMANGLGQMHCTNTVTVCSPTGSILAPFPMSIVKS